MSNLPKNIAFAQLPPEKQAQYVADAINLYEAQRDIELLSLMAKADNLIVLTLTAKDDQEDANGNVRTELMVRSPRLGTDAIRAVIASANTMVQGSPLPHGAADSGSMH